MVDYKVAVKNTLRSKLDIKSNKQNREKLCSELNISESTIDRWLSLNDSNTPKTEDLPIICKVLDITLYELFNITLPTELTEALRKY